MKESFYSKWDPHCCVIVFPVSQQNMKGHQWHTLGSAVSTNLRGGRDVQGCCEQHRPFCHAQMCLGRHLSNQYSYEKAFPCLQSPVVIPWLPLPTTHVEKKNLFNKIKCYSKGKKKQLSSLWKVDVIERCFTHHTVDLCDQSYTAYFSQYNLGYLNKQNLTHVMLKPAKP